MASRTSAWPAVLVLGDSSRKFLNEIHRLADGHRHLKKASTGTSRSSRAFHGCLYRLLELPFVFRPCRHLTATKLPTCRLACVATPIWNPTFGKKTAGLPAYREGGLGRSIARRAPAHHPDALRSRVRVVGGEVGATDFERIRLLPNGGIPSGSFGRMNSPRAPRSRIRAVACTRPLAVNPRRK